VGGWQAPPKLRHVTPRRMASRFVLDRVPAASACVGTIPRLGCCQALEPRGGTLGLVAKFRVAGVPRNRVFRSDLGTDSGSGLE
jgi:hypothetical protein